MSATSPAVPSVVDAEIAAAAEAENLLALDPAQALKVEELRHVKAQLRALKKRDEDLTAEIKTTLGGYQGATVLGKLVLSLTKRAGRRTADLDVLRTYPEAYAASVKQGAEQSILHFVK